MTPPTLYRPPTEPADEAPAFALESTSDPALDPAADPGAGVRMEDALPGLLFAGGMLIVVVVLMRHTRRKMTRRNQAEEDAAERIRSIHERAGSRDRLETVVAEVEQTARHIAAVLDNKIARLEQLIADADDRLERLERASRPAAGFNGTGNGVPSEIAGDPLADRVYELADDGKSALQIAQETGTPVGQIELMLALRP